MLVNSAPDTLGIAFRPAIKPAHDALQVREFPDHLCDQIALAKTSRGLEVVCELRRVRHLRDCGQELQQALCLVVIAAQLFLKQDVPERLHSFLQLALSIHPPEKRGVCQARFQDAFMTLADFLSALRIDVDNREEERKELPFLVHQRKVFLVLAHHRDQNLLRQIKELRIEGSANHGRTLVQVYNGLEQLFIRNQPASGFRRFPRQAVNNYF